MHVTIYYYSDQIKWGEMLVECSRHKIRNADKILIGKPWRVYWSEITMETYVRTILKRGWVFKLCALTSSRFLISDVLLRVMKSIDVLSAVTAKAAAHVRWGARAVPLISLTHRDSVMSFPTPPNCSVHVRCVSRFTRFPYTRWFWRTQLRV
jgi:hypothetical protein